MATDETLLALVREMSLREKTAQLRSVWAPIADDGTLDAAAARDSLGEGIGHIARPGSILRRGPRAIAEFTNAVQRFLVEHTRLGIPALFHEETLAGVQTMGATCFPQAVGMSSTWDPALVEQVGAAIGAELRAVGLHVGLAPVVDVLRDHRWGRVEECYGEDAFLVGTLGAAYVRGLQASGCIAVLKHFLGYSASSGGRNTTEVRVGPRELRDVHGLAFEIATRDGGAQAVMAAYPVVDRVPPTSDRRLLTGYLRETLGFEGLVVSDYYGIDMLEWKHHVSPDAATSAARALAAGIDGDLPAGSRFGEPLLEAIERGMASIDDVDAAVLRVLERKRAAGLFDDPFANAADASIVVHNRDHQALAQIAAEQSIVLLTNDGTLPIHPEVRSILLIGPNGDDALAMLGDYSYQIQAAALAEITALASELPALADIAAELPPPLSPNRPVPVVDPTEHVAIPSVFDALNDRAHCAVSFVRGTSISGGETDDIEAAVDAARNADLVIAAVGDRSGVLVSGTVGEGRDGARLDLPGAQRILLEAVLETGTPIVVVLLNGRPFTLEWLVDRANALVDAWFPGERGAAAIARVLFGDVTPGGKLTTSFVAHPGVLPLTYDHVPMEGLGEYYDASLVPVFPFGHGLSYTTFDYSELELRRDVAIDGEVELSFVVENSGVVSGDEICQVYVRDQLASVARPERELRAFARVTLQPGERRRIAVAVPTDLLAFHDSDLRLVVEPGVFSVMIGASSSDIRLSGETEVLGPGPRVVDNRARSVCSRTSVLDV